MTERDPNLSDEALSSLLASRLPRYPAPPRLRVAITEALTPPRRRVGWWLSPALAAAGTALALILFFLPQLPRVAPVDPVERLMRAVIAEHTRVLLWGARRPDIVPAGLPWLTRETGIGLNSVFSGDDRVSLESAEPVYLEQRRGLALHYHDDDGHLMTYVVIPAPGMPVPERLRVQVDRWRPALLQDSGFSVLVWKHGDLACFLIADLVSPDGVARFKDYFTRVRRATEPVPAS